MSQPVVAKKRKALPPGLIVRTGKFVWNSMWHVMMSQMAPRNQSGAYTRPESAFRGREITPEAGRYRLIVGMSCPWAHRTLVTRVVKGLEDAIALITVYPSTDEGVWLFDVDQDNIDCRTLPEFYQSTQSGYSALRTEIDELNEKIYVTVNNGVYRCGFAQTQEAYDQAVTALFETLDELDNRLATQRYLCGDALTLADI